jgi:hypothetical protein
MCKQNQTQIEGVDVLVQACDLEDGDGWARIGLANGKGIRYERIFFVEMKFDHTEWRAVKYTENRIFTLADFEDFIRRNECEILRLVEAL